MPFSWNRIISFTIGGHFVLKIDMIRYEYKHVAWIMKFYLFDINLESMTLVLKLDLDIVTMFVKTKNEDPTLSI